MTLLHLHIDVCADIEWLVEALDEAEEGSERIRRALAEPAVLAYAASVADQRVAALVMRWDTDESEIVYVAVQPAVRGKGIGKAIVLWSVAEARRRGVASVIVGTGNCSLDNIAFYQKCGFRMHAVKRDYFAYIDPPVVENGILLRDMLVFKIDLVAR
ncbi:MAG: GNAT family N-acetyltransferase [Chloroflexi bacterium]|nr:GNAT family N-acetyltransferase [Chloroflexota bacterium]